MCLCAMNAYFDNDEKNFEDSLNGGQYVNKYFVLECFSL